MIRKAKQEDAAQIIPLLHCAIGSIANTLAGTPDDDEALRILTDFYRQKGNRISYENILVEEQDGQVVGMLVAYHGSRSDTLDKPLLDRICRQTGRTDYTFEREAGEDEYYLDSLAVHEAYRGRGFAKGLMLAFEAQAMAAGHRKLSLLVEENNDRAFALYTKMGYREDGKTMLKGTVFRHMVKYV
ncbi:GNAT family N-acetyltransferase [Brevibacillus sp. B_LB10_24]|uniref:GNAT family N-acetyltransferase n=1 Tax=Brevibacillus sp. B_LB10_24 TaxID=3380645 RepID=UPI0038B9F346